MFLAMMTKHEENNDPMDEIPLEYDDDGYISDDSWTSWTCGRRG